MKRYRLSVMIVVGLVIVMFPSCDKDNPVDDLIPDVYVNVRISPSSIEFGNLEIVGNHAYLDGYGYRGIVIYHATQNEYYAYDRTPPHNFPNADSCILTVDDSGFFAVDNCSENSYQLLDGSPTGIGDASLTLKRYRTNWDGTFLYISN